MSVVNISKIPLMCNGNCIAKRIMYPETILEKFMGLRKIKLAIGEAMVWIFKHPQLQLFDSFGCQQDIGYLALGKDGKIIDKGILKPNKAKFVTCAYWIEIKPETALSLNIGDIVDTTWLWCKTSKTF